MVGKKSIVWNFFSHNLENSTVTCSICMKDLKFFGNTTNLRKHLKNIHPMQYGESNITFDTSDSDVHYIVVNSLPSVSQQQSNIIRKRSRKSMAAIPKYKQSKMQKQMKSRPPSQEVSIFDRKHIDEKLIKMIAADYLPLSIVENQGFIEYSLKLNPLYKIPNVAFLSETMLPTFHREATIYLRSVLETVENISVSIDAWTSDKDRRYVTVSAHFIYDDTAYSYVIATREIIGTYNSESIGGTLTEILVEWNILNKIVTIVSDTEINIEDAVRERLRKDQFPCVAHTLNLTIGEAIVENQEFTEILNKCREIVNHFKQNMFAAEELENLQSQMGVPVLKVKRDSIDRWNSITAMIERLIEIKDSLCLLLDHLSNAPNSLQIPEWDILKDCLAVLKPAETLAEILSDEQYPPISLVIPLIRGMERSLNNIETQTDCGSALKTSLLTVINRRLGCFENNKIVAKATFLDPRFKKIAFASEEDANNTQKWVTEELKSLINTKEDEKIQTGNLDPTDSSNVKGEDLWAYFDAKIADVKSTATASTNASLSIRQYLEVPHITRSKNPIEFWKQHKMMFPALYELAVKYLCIPATCVPAEWMFSKTGQLIDSRRNRLPSKHLDMIVFLNSYCAKE